MNLEVNGNDTSKTLQGSDGEDILSANGNAKANTLQGGNGNDELKAYGNASANILQGGEDEDKFWVRDNASANTLQGGEGSDSLNVFGSAHGNTLQGDNGDDALRAYGNASANTLQGGEGSDELHALSNVSFNTLQGGEGKDLLRAAVSASGNALQGGGGEDKLCVYDDASGNTLQGDGDSDLLYAHDNTKTNTLQGGDGQDVIISIARYSNILQGDAGDDFILNYAPDLSQHKNLSLTGGTGQDIIIGAGTFWQHKAKTTEDSDLALGHNGPSLWHFDAGGDDDVIVPYLPLDDLALDYLKGPLTSNQTAKINARTLVPTTTPCDITYDIVTGDGQDIVLLNSRPAEHTTTIIQDFDVGTDKLYFDDQAMAETFAAHIAFAKTFSLPTVLMDYKGHQYDINFASPPIKPTLKTIDVDGIKLEYPDFGHIVTSGLMQQNYAIYDQITLSNRIQTTADTTKLNRTLLDGIGTEKTLSQAYTLDLDHDIFVTTQATLDLVANDKGGFTTKARDLFMQEQDHRTTLYTSLSTTADKSCSYYDNIPDHIVGVVVVQEQNSGLVFTTGSAEDVAKLSLPEQTIQTFAARDFFSRGHFAKMNPTDDQANLSVTMKIGLIYKDQGKIITTALSDPITIKAAR